MADAPVTVAVREALAVVRLRVGAADAARAAAAFPLPAVPLSSLPGTADALWIAPDQWLLTSATCIAADLLARCDERLGGLLYHATDATDALECITLAGRASRTLLGMLGGADFSSEAFPPGRCARLRLAKLAVVVRALDADRFELFVDRSLGHDLLAHLRQGSGDPLLLRA